MRQTLRRSCAACAKSKHSCDLRTPRCSRCLKRRVQCIYANEPLTAPGPDADSDPSEIGRYQFGSLDPFDSYPPTRLPRDHVQRLIHSFIHKIAFQYYPLDLNASTNPFLVSWWPLALGDPALFHVSLQTACLDEELLAQRGFRASELLMADSVGLLRRKVGEVELATQDGTMDSVITLAAIEFGKGNASIAEMHVEGVSSLVNIRGGISSVRQTSPLTARMVSWVSMLIKGHPQFQTQDDRGIGDGIPPIPEWQLDSGRDESGLFNPDIIEQLADEVQNVFIRLKNAFRRARRTPFPSTRLHDLTCFVVHRLLLTAPAKPQSPSAEGSVSSSSPVTECVRCAIILYMFTIQGPTYFSHAVILESLVARFIGYLEQHLRLDSVPRNGSGSMPLDLWLLSIGLVASSSTSHVQHRWFVKGARALAGSLGLGGWVDVRGYVMGVLWLEMGCTEDIFRRCWDGALGSGFGREEVGLGLGYVKPGDIMIE